MGFLIVGINLMALDVAEFNYKRRNLWEIAVVIVKQLPVLDFF